MHCGTYPRPSSSETFNKSASIRLRRHTLSPAGSVQVPFPHFSIPQHFWGAGHCRSCWQVVPHTGGSSIGQLPGLFKRKLDGQHTPYSCAGWTRHLYIGGQVGLPGVLPQRNGRGESVIWSGSPAGHIVASDFDLRQLGIGGQGSREHDFSISWQDCAFPGHTTPRQGSLHSHFWHPVSVSIWKFFIILLNSLKS